MIRDDRLKIKIVSCYRSNYQHLIGQEFYVLVYDIAAAEYVIMTESKNFFTIAERDTQIIEGYL